MCCDVIITFLPPLFGSLVGVFSAYILGLRTEEKRKDKEREEIKKNIVRTIVGELTEIRRNINEHLKDVKAEEKGIYFYIPGIILPTDSKEAIVYSGNFSLLEDNTQRKISRVYLDIEVAKHALERIDYRIRHQQDYKGELTFLNSRLPSLLDEIDSLINELPYPIMA